MPKEKIWKALVEKASKSQEKNQTSIPVNDHFHSNFTHKSNPEQTYDLFSKT